MVSNTASPSRVATYNRVSRSGPVVEEATERLVKLSLSWVGTLAQLAASASVKLMKFVDLLACSSKILLKYATFDVSLLSAWRRYT